MAQAQISQTAWDLIYLLKCALHDRVPDEARVQAMDQQALYKLAKAHSVAAMAAMALERCGVIGGEWKQAKGNSVRRTLLLDAERAEICCFLEENGIWYMPLKGVILKDMYPKLGMREMADNDILFDGNYRTDLQLFMEKRGYQAEIEGNGIHDSYFKQPIFNFEMHRELINPNFSRRWNQYYQNVKERLIRDQEESVSFRFSDEDFYVFMNVHAYKHYGHRGTGIRTLTDSYVYLREKEDQLDWTYIDQEMQNLNVSDYEKQCRELAKRIFADNEENTLSEDECGRLSYFLGSGTYGTRQNQIENGLRGVQSSRGKITVWTKIRYIFQRIFPDKEFVKRNYIIAERYSWMYAPMCIYRLVRHVVRLPGSVWDELARLWKIKE